MQLHREMISAKIKGDAGTYEVWRIDWYNRRVYVYRACGCEWVDMDKITLSLPNKPLDTDTKSREL